MNSAASSGYFEFLKIIQGSASTWAAVSFPDGPWGFTITPKYSGVPVPCGAYFSM